MTVGSLFAGIGGFDLAAERVGWKTKWQVEIDPFCRKVLEKHWPNVRRYEDVQTVHGKDACEHGPRPNLIARRLCERCLEPVDVICGGFPCQDISSAGAKAGLSGKQSGLWFQMARIICQLQPRYVVVENVADLLARGLGDVLGNLAASGYSAEWDCLQAAAVGAPHGRDRLWLIAYPDADKRRRQISGECDGDPASDTTDRRACGNHLDGFRADVSDATIAAEAIRARRWTGQRLNFERWRADARQRAGWEAEPAICRVADGVSPGLDNARLAALGNSIVPQIAEWIFTQINQAEAEMNADAASYGKPGTL